MRIVLSRSQCNSIPITLGIRLTEISNRVRFRKTAVLSPQFSGRAAGIPTYYGDNKLLLTVCHHSTKPEGFQGHSLKLAHMILMQARTRVRTHSHEGVYTHSLCKTL